MNPSLTAHQKEHGLAIKFNLSSTFDFQANCHTIKYHCHPEGIIWVLYQVFCILSWAAPPDLPTVVYLRSTRCYHQLNGRCSKYNRLMGRLPSRHIQVAANYSFS